MIFKQDDALNMATCVGVGVYAEALTYGQTYEILARDEDKNQVKVQGDNGRARWYPCGCFDMTGKEVPKCVQIHLDDRDFTSIVEVSLQFSDGQRRWCFFATPDMLSQLGGEHTLGRERLLSYGAAHMIVVSAMSQEIIERAITYIESQGELLTSTKPIKELLSEGSKTSWGVDLIQVIPHNIPALHVIIDNGADEGAFELFQCHTSGLCRFLRIMNTKTRVRQTPLETLGHPSKETFYCSLGLSRQLHRLHPLRKEFSR